MAGNLTLEEVDRLINVKSIVDLPSSKVYRQLAEVLRKNEDLVRENDRLRKQLLSSMLATKPMMDFS